MLLGRTCADNLGELTRCRVINGDLQQDIQDASENRSGR